MQNDSSFAIVEIRVAERHDSRAEDILHGDVLRPGESLTIRLDCGTYDVQLVDEDRATCELRNVDLCFSRADWIIRNNTCAFRPTRAAQNAEQPELANPDDAPAP